MLAFFTDEAIASQAKLQQTESDYRDALVRIAGLESELSTAARALDELKHVKMYEIRATLLSLEVAVH